MVDVNRICLYCMKEKPSPDQRCIYCSRSNDELKVLPHQLQPLSILQGKYLVGRVLGEGGFGITYVALDLVNDRRIALKEMYLSDHVIRTGDTVRLLDNSPNGVSYYNECKKQFIQEARALYRLEDTSGVVKIYDYFEENNTTYIAMEYLDGPDLKMFLNNNGGKISWEETFYLLRPVMKCMILVQQAGIIHRDISPDNIKYLTTNQMKIIDFGSTKTLHSDLESQIVYVKPGYAPPEQYSNGFNIGPWMDVYAMSATMYRCVAGRVPQPSPDRIHRDELMPPSALGADIPPAVEEVLLKGMALDPKDRYQDMWALYQALKTANAASGWEEHKDLDQKIGSFMTTMNKQFGLWAKRYEELPQNRRLIIQAVGFVLLLVIIMGLILLISR